MPIEGISMTTVFSLVAVGIAISLSTYIGGYYLRPIFDVDTIMAAVAYDLATLYDLAYTLPGEVIMRYYGPTICKWNYKMPGNTPQAFHCIDAKSVIINEIIVDKQYLLVYQDPYISYDSVHNKENPIIKYMGDANFADAISSRRPAYLFVALSYFNRQVSRQIDFTNEQIFYGSFATAPIAASFTDINILTDAETPSSIQVEDYSFFVKKSKVGNYYYSLASNPVPPQELTSLINKISRIYNNLCQNGSEANSGYYGFKDDKVLQSYSNLFDYEVINLDFSDKQDYFLKLYPAIRLRVYNSNIEKLFDSWSFDSGPLSDLGRNDLTANSANTEQGLFFKAYRFSEGSYLKTEEKPAFSSMAISMWINPSNIDSIQGYEYLISNAAANAKGFGLRINSDKKLELHLANSPADSIILESNSQLRKNNWYHVVANIGSQKAGIYINGELDSQADFSANNLQGNFGITIGASASNNLEYNFNGLIDDAKLFKEQLTETEILQLYSLIPGNFICQERLSLSYGTAAKDSSLELKWGFEENEIISNHSYKAKEGQTELIPSEEGIFGKTYLFEANEKISVDYKPALEKMSISFWIKPSNLGSINNFQYLVSNNNDCCDESVAGFGIRINSDKKLEFHIASDLSSQGVLTSSSKIIQDEWTHVAVIFDYGKASIYLNGEFDSTANLDVLSVLSTYNLTIGSLAYNSPDYYNFKGLIDELRLFNKALNQEEITYLKNTPSAVYSSSFFGKIKSDDYYTEYCFNIDLFKQRKECQNVAQVIFTQDFIDVINKRTLYYASWNSCIKPFLSYDSADKKLVLSASLAEFNIIAGGCDDK